MADRIGTGRSGLADTQDMPRAEQVKWFSVAGKLRSFSGGEDAWLVFNPVTSDTHLLNFFTHALIQRLGDCPSTLEALYEFVQQDESLQAGDVPIDFLMRTVMELEQAGLVFSQRQA